MKIKGQVWIETVLYTLIGLALIGTVLAFIMPKINETKDKLAVDQTLEAMNDLASNMDLIPGNVRQVDFTIRRGEMRINSEDNNIVFVFDDIAKPLSEVGQKISRGKITMITEKGQKYYQVSLMLNLSNSVDLRYGGVDVGEEVDYRFVTSPRPYKIEIRSKSPDENSNGKQIIVLNSLS